MMSVVMSLLVIIVLLAGGGWLMTRFKRQDAPTNRYRHYTAKAPQKSTKVRRNRYRPSPRQEPNLVEPVVENFVSDAMEMETVREPMKRVKKEKQPRKIKGMNKVASPPRGPKKVKKKSDLSAQSEDPDIVLGLKPIPTEAQITLKPPPPLPPLMTFHMMAEKEQLYTGYELLQAMLSVGMRYGKHHIFHRHEEKTGRGSILFSLASAERPGTFDLQKMGNFSTPGLSLFFSAGDVEDPTAVYELMLQTAGQLVEDLGGTVFDVDRQLLTSNSIIKHRQLLRRYMADQQVPDLFEEIVE